MHRFVTGLIQDHLATGTGKLLQDDLVRGGRTIGDEERMACAKGLRSECLCFLNDAVGFQQ